MHGRFPIIGGTSGPHPVTLCHTSRDLPSSPKVRHTSRTPIFSSTCIGLHTYVFTGRFVLVCGGFSGEFCLEGFVRGSFCSSPSVRIHSLQQKAKHHFNFRFYMYAIFLKCDVT